MELISWIATFFILISFVFEGWKLRTLNGIGAVLWTIWGWGMGETAVIFLNLSIIVVHLWKLLSIERGGKSIFDFKKFLKTRH